MKRLKKIMKRREKTHNDIKPHETARLLTFQIFIIAPKNW
jgi:hypothetical protein